MEPGGVCEKNKKNSLIYSLNSWNLHALRFAQEQLNRHKLGLGKNAIGELLIVLMNTSYVERLRLRTRFAHGILSMNEHTDVCAAQR